MRKKGMAKRWVLSRREVRRIFQFFTAADKRARFFTRPYKENKSSGAEDFYLYRYGSECRGSLPLFTFFFGQNKGFVTGPLTGSVLRV